MRMATSAKTQLSSLRDVGPEEAMLAACCAVRRMVHGPHPTAPSAACGAAPLPCGVQLVHSGGIVWVWLVEKGRASCKSAFHE